MKSLVLLFFVLCSGHAFAGEGLFSRTYSVETVPGGHYELEQAVRNRTGRVSGSYSAFDFLTELEYGVTDNFQTALYLNTGHIHAVNSSDDDFANPSATGFTANKFIVESIETEFLYRVTNPVKDPIGLAFYLEPEFSFYDMHNGRRYNHTFANEFRVILQKNFFDDMLILAYNAVAEIEYIRFDGDSNWSGELDWNNELGATYRVFPNWYMGLEARNHNEIGDFKVHEHSVYWAGPAIHYGGEKFWATLGFLYQVYGVPHGVDADTHLSVGDHRFLRSHEKLETTLKVGMPF